MAWKPSGLAATLWRSTRFATLVFLRSILTGAVGRRTGGGTDLAELEEVAETAEFGFNSALDSAALS